MVEGGLGRIGEGFDLQYMGWKLLYCSRSAIPSDHQNARIVFRNSIQMAMLSDINSLTTTMPGYPLAARKGSGTKYAVSLSVPQDIPQASSPSLRSLVAPINRALLFWGKYIKIDYTVQVPVKASPSPRRPVGGSSQLLGDFFVSARLPVSAYRSPSWGEA